MSENPFRYFKTPPEIIQLGVLMCRTKASASGSIASGLISEIRSVSGGPKRCAGSSNGAAASTKCSSKIRGETHYLWRAVDHEGEVLEPYITKKRNKAAELKFLRKAMKRYGNPEVVVTDKCPSYHAAMKVIGNAGRQETGRHLNNRAENSHQPFRRRERAMSRFRRMRSLQKFASMRSSAHNHFNHQRNIERRAGFKSLRDAALRKWRELLVV